MLSQSFIPEITQNLMAVIDSLQKQPFVQMAVLCTSDGLPIYRQNPQVNHVAAVAGFLLSAAKQSSNMLGKQGCQEVSVELANDTVLICYPFMAGETELILTILLEKKIAYKRFMMQAISTIQKAVEE